MPRVCVRSSVCNLSQLSLPLQLALLPLLCACGELGDFFGSESDYESPVLSDTFAVSSAFVASGAMGDGADERLFEIFPPEGETDACSRYISRKSGSKGNCYRFEYRTNGVQNWAGVYWQSPENNWGQDRGHLIKAGKFDRVRFRVALMEVHGDGTRVAAASRMTFWAGGMGHGPSAAALALEAQGRAAALDAGLSIQDGGVPMLSGLFYKDAFKTSELVRPVLPDNATGEPNWNDFSLTIPMTTTLPDDHEDPLRHNEPAYGEPYERVIGAFAWALGHPAGTPPGEGKTLWVFIDDIVWEARQ